MEKELRLFDYIKVCLPKKMCFRLKIEFLIFFFTEEEVGVERNERERETENTTVHIGTDTQRYKTQIK